MEETEQPDRKQPDTDVSRNTIFVLVILTLLISILGTWTVITQINGFAPAAPEPVKQVSASGEVRLIIGQPEAPSTAMSTGEVVLEITKP